MKTFFLCIVNVAKYLYCVYINYIFSLLDETSSSASLRTSPVSESFTSEPSTETNFKTFSWQLKDVGTGISLIISVWLKFFLLTMCVLKESSKFLLTMCVCFKRKYMYFNFF